MGVGGGVGVAVGIGVTVGVGLVVGVGEGPEKGFRGGVLQDDITNAIRRQITRALFFIGMTITQALRDVNVHEYMRVLIKVLM